MQLNLSAESAYFGGKKVLPAVARDRLGSVRGNGSGANRPYGENYSSQNTDGFATYYQDAASGLNYADQRYYSAGYGRFLTADPYQVDHGPSPHPEDSSSWNRFSYASMDPVNKVDPSGLDPYDVTQNCPDIRAESPDQVALDFYNYGLRVCTPDPRVPGGATYTATQRQALTNGFHYAFDDATENLSCLTYLSGISKNADNFQIAEAYATIAETLAATTYRILSLPRGTGAATADNTDVFLNSNGAFFNIRPGANGAVTISIPDSITGRLHPVTFGSLLAFQGFVLLHELGHQLGRYGEDVNAVANGRNSHAILTNCFSTNAQGQYVGGATF
jgi:RHS repeat-associated protein